MSAVAELSRNRWLSFNFCREKPVCQPRVESSANSPVVLDYALLKVVS